jgi:hypothetical protein
MIALPFILNTLLNFAVGLLVARFLGPAEYGRYALALSIAVVIQTLALDWLRLSASRFYSDHDRLAHPEIRATLDRLVIGIVAIACLAAMVVALSGLPAPLSPGLCALAIGAALANGLFDFATALIRARFLDRAYGRLVVAKNVLALALTVGGAWIFASPVRSSRAATRWSTAPRGSSAPMARSSSATPSMPCRSSSPTSSTRRSPPRIARSYRKSTASPRRANSPSPSNSASASSARSARRSTCFCSRSRSWRRRRSGRARRDARCRATWRSSSPCSSRRSRDAG